MDSEEENLYYNSGDDNDKTEEPEDDCGGNFYYSGDDDKVEEDRGNQEPYSNTKKDYIILKQEGIKQLQENDISEISSVLSVSRGIACALLLRNNWSLTSVFDKWPSNEEGGAPEAISILKKRKSPIPENYCKICFETVEIKNMLSVACGHPFCADCWKSYFTVSINDGPGCLKLRCPEPECKAIAGLDMVEFLVSDDDRYKYYKYIYRSYIECNRNRKWCPAPGCENAIEFAAGGCESYDVVCDCSYKFCWKCTEECHRPVDCATVAKWIEKNSSEEDNVTWIAAYTKPCPECHSNIEKNQGCNHMSCACGYEFCWLCLKPWISWEDDRCNIYYEEEGKTGSSGAAREYLERYAHYYERWAANHKSRDIALADTSRARKEHIPRLSKVQEEPEKLLQFVVEAWDQIVECRRVLKWSYAYGYYMDVDKTEKRTFFEFLQWEAETALERLHYCVEKEMEKYIKADCRLEDFRDFRAKITCLTGVRRNYFQNLVRALVNNLCEVESIGSTQACTSKQSYKIGGKHW